MRVRGPLCAAVLVAALVPVTASPVRAQDGFLFSRPMVQFTVRAGPVLHRAQSDLFDFMTSELTLQRDDFRAPSLGGEVAVAVLPRLDVSLGLGWSSVQKRSESALYEGTDDLPIEQRTTLRMIPLSLSTRFYPASRGRTVSSLAWLPVQTTPYVGAGVAMTWHRLQMDGEFVDEEDLNIFRQNFQSSGRSTTFHGRAGIDHWFTARVGVNLDARYTFGSATPSDDFRTFDSLDLSGVQVGVGLTLRW